MTLVNEICLSADSTGVLSLVVMWYVHVSESTKCKIWIVHCKVSIEKNVHMGYMRPTWCTGLQNHDDVASYTF